MLLFFNICGWGREDIIYIAKKRKGMRERERDLGKGP